jgi:hypothetical protein
MSVLSISDRSHSVARPGFSRWMVPPAALCIHLCIGQAYAFSVFKSADDGLSAISRMERFSRERADVIGPYPERNLDRDVSISPAQSRLHRPSGGRFDDFEAAPGLLH